jgi:cobalt-zinc-cadmium efflux system protein
MEAVERFFNPQPIIANWVIIAASVAVVVDLGTVFLLWGMSRGNLNIRAAFIHNLTDAGASFAVILGALMVQQFGWLWVDPALCLGIAAYILFTALPMLRQSASILMNHVPPHLELSAIATTFETFDEVVEVHHLHVWEIDERVIGLEAHVVLREDLSLANLQPLSQKLRDELKHRWNVGHTTFEFEGPDAQCARRNC